MSTTTRATPKFMGGKGTLGEAGELLSEHRLVVKRNSDGEVYHCQGGDRPHGATMTSHEEGEAAGVRLLQLGTVILTAAAAISAFSDVYATYDGKVTAAGGDYKVGMALSAATADGGMVEVLPANPFEVAQSDALRLVVRDGFAKLPAGDGVFDQSTHGDTSIEAADLANIDFSVVGTNVASATIARGPSGGVTLTTSNADGDQAILTANTDSGFSGQLGSALNLTTDKAVSCEAQFVTPVAASMDNALLAPAGFKLTPGTLDTGTDANQAYCLADIGNDSGGTFTDTYKLVVSSGGNDEQIDTGVAVAQSTRTRIKVAIGHDRKARLYIDGELKATSTLTLPASTGSLKPVCGIEADEAVAKVLTVERMVVAANR